MSATWPSPALRAAVSLRAYPMNVLQEQDATNLIRKADYIREAMSYRALATAFVWLGSRHSAHGPPRDAGALDKDVGGGSR